MTGKFGFIAVEGWMDCREAAIDDRPGWSSPGTAMTNAIQPAVVGGLFLSRTDLSRDTSTFTWATTRHFGPSGSDRACLQAGGRGHHQHGSRRAFMGHLPLARSVDMGRLTNTPCPAFVYADESLCAAVLAVVGRRYECGSARSRLCLYMSANGQRQGLGSAGNRDQETKSGRVVLYRFVGPQHALLGEAHLGSESVGGLVLRVD